MRPMEVRVMPDQNAETQTDRFTKLSDIEDNSTMKTHMSNGPLAIASRRNLNRN